MAKVLTRDSLIWWFGMGGAVLVGLSTVGDADLITKYGIPEQVIPYLRFGALIVGILSAKNATSSLPHSEEGDAKITPSGK